MIGPKWIGRSCALALVLATAACATTPILGQAAADRLNSVWAADNQITASKLGSRVVGGTTDQVARAARAALERVGLSVDASATSATSIAAGHTYPPGAFSWSPLVRSQEEAKARQLFIGVLGPSGARVTIAPVEERVSAQLLLSPAGKSAVGLTATFRTRPTVAACPSVCPTEMPPAALKLLYRDFWDAFDRELARVKAEDAPKTPRKVPAKPPAPKKPKDWTPPPRDWQPPPKPRSE